MVKIPENIRNVVEDYLKDLSDDIRIDKAIIFGSYAKGNYNIDSDIDLAIFSDSFKDMDRVESIKYLLKRARKFRGVDLQPISFTTRDYEEKLGIVEEVINTGIEVFIN
ncbi:nucleotidyltransferase domain-containing protein [Acidilutibacter cellobiosedens]|jgi:predicted nucleotidyltransferase|uniref:Nucleotidyltransferase domain-containing protein n=1 Tax=Acidilutibacter cellobiosedens TaxID=2507161 RepID=A0A410QDG3_9FIRM|nr:nucleotidyltransferase domain-containing protein [Acidilutibacter cellobiosedens]QAT61969.1 nucleotidyltransferase domain-containing protein [Acidilutibacter cellobiosedens]